MAEAEKRWDAVIQIMKASPNSRAGEEGQADLVLGTESLTFSDINTPGANNYGYMVFAGRDTCTMIPANDVKRIDLTERKVQAVTAKIRGV